MSGPEIFHTDTVEQKHESLENEAEAKSEARGQGIVLRSPLAMKRVGGAR